MVGRCGVWCAGLGRAGPGGAACRLLAALRGRPVQIVTSAGKYVVTKFPFVDSNPFSAFSALLLVEWLTTTSYQAIEAKDMCKLPYKPHRYSTFIFALS